MSEQPKTECPECGNVWQEHTISEAQGCMAIMDMEFSAAFASRSKPRPKPSTVEICPVCSKTSEEHTEDGVRSCLDKWRKREQGATGLKLQGSFVEAQFEDEEPDPVKRAQLRAQLMQSLCPCGKAYGDHTEDEMLAWAERNRRF